MALTQEERISISKKIIEIPVENANAVSLAVSIQDSKVKAQKEDDGNKKLMDGKTVIINPYQDELAYLDGNIRRELSEQDIIDAVNKKEQNDLFPNVLTIPLPSVPDGVWKNFPPFSNNIAVGKDYIEIYSNTGVKEQDIVDSINIIISTIESNNDQIQMSTGQECIDGDPNAGTCTGDTPPGATDEATCLLNGGTWTSTPTPDIIQNKADLQADILILISNITDWENILNNEKSAIQTADLVDTNSTRNTQNAIAIADIDAAIVIIDNWQALADFYTAHGATDCPQFNSLDPNTFPPTKLAVNDLQALKDEIVARTTFQSNRTVELNSDTYLGSINQDFNTGEIVGATGLFGIRFRIIDMRVNLMVGSLGKVLGLEGSQKAQGELISSNESALIVLEDTMAVSKFRSPASGTSTIHVIDGSLFSIGDTVYVTADTQTEIAATISNIQDNTVYLSANIPKKYRQDDGARLYKEL